MAENTEVEKVLQEIRERVRQEINRSAASSTSTLNNIAARSPEISRNLLNGAGPQPPSDDELWREATNALARMKMNLTTTENTWNNLPPLVSRRAGQIARLELWVKRQFKRLTRWFTWDQVNFNLAVHQSLGELHAALLSHELILNALQKQVDSQHDLSLKIVSGQQEKPVSAINLETSLIVNDSGNSSLLSQPTKLTDSQLRLQIDEIQKEFQERIQKLLDEQQFFEAEPALRTNLPVNIADNSPFNLERPISQSENKFDL